MPESDIASLRGGAQRLGEAAEELRAASHLVSAALAPGWRGATWARFEQHRERAASSLARDAGVLASFAGATRQYAGALETAQGLMGTEPVAGDALRVVAERRYWVALQTSELSVDDVRDVVQRGLEATGAWSGLTDSLGTFFRLGRVFAGYLRGGGTEQLASLLLRGVSWVEKLPGGRLIARLLPVTSWVTAAKDLYDGGGYQGWRGAVTRGVAGNFLASQAVSSKAPVLPVLIWAAASDMLYDGWSVANYTYDNRAVITPALRKAHRWAQTRVNHGVDVAGGFAHRKGSQVRHAVGSAVDQTQEAAVDAGRAAVRGFARAADLIPRPRLAW